MGEIVICDIYCGTTKVIIFTFITQPSLYFI